MPFITPRKNRTTEIVELRDRLWVITREDPNGILYLKSLPHNDPAAEDYAYAECRVARADQVRFTGQTAPLFKQTVEPGDYIIAPTHLGPGAPTHIVGRVESVQPGDCVEYWRADGTGRQSTTIRVVGLWLLTYADRAIGQRHFERDEARFVPLAADWWREGYRVIYDPGLERLKNQAKPKAAVQLTLGDLRTASASQAM